MAKRNLTVSVFQDEYVGNDTLTLRTEPLTVNNDMRISLSEDSTKDDKEPSTLENTPSQQLM